MYAALLSGKEGLRDTSRMAGVNGLEPMPEPPEDAIFCLLCRGTVVLPDGNTSKYERHLKIEHGVFHNRQWLVDTTLACQSLGGTKEGATIPNLGPSDDIPAPNEKITLCQTNQLDETPVIPRTENSKEKEVLSKTHLNSSTDMTHPMVTVKQNFESGDEEVTAKESVKSTPLKVQSNTSDSVNSSTLNLLEKQSSITSMSISISSSTPVEFSRETSRSSSKQGDEVWAECNEELSKLVQEISGKTDSEQEEQGGEADSSFNVTIPAGGNYSDIDEYDDRTSTPDTPERERIIKKTKFLKVDVRNQKISEAESFDPVINRVESTVVVDKNSIKEQEEDSSSNMRQNQRTVKYNSDASDPDLTKKNSKTKESNKKSKIVDSLSGKDEIQTIVTNDDLEKQSNNAKVSRSSSSSIQQSDCAAVKCESDLSYKEEPIKGFKGNVNDEKNTPLDSEPGMEGIEPTKTNERNADEKKIANKAEITLDALLAEDSSSAESNVSNEYDNSSFTLNTPEKERIINKTKSLQVVVTKQKIPGTDSDESDFETPSTRQENATTKSKENIIDDKKTSTKEKHIPSNPSINPKENSEAVNIAKIFDEEESPKDAAMKGESVNGNDSKQEAIAAKSGLGETGVVNKTESVVNTDKQVSQIQEIQSESSSSTKITCATLKYNSDSSDEERPNETAKRKITKQNGVDQKLEKSITESDENTITNTTECTVKYNCDSSEEKEPEKESEQIKKTNIILEMVHDEPPTILNEKNITSNTECNPDQHEGTIPISWMENIVKNHKKCFVRIKNEHYEVDSGQERAEQNEEGEQGCDDPLKHEENNGKDSGEEITGRSGKRRSVFLNDVCNSEESDRGEKNIKNRKEVKVKGQKIRKRYKETKPISRKHGVVKYDSDSSDGEELAKASLKRVKDRKSDSSSSLKKNKIKRQKHDNDDTEDHITPRRKRGIVKYNCDSSDEEEPKKELAMTAPRKVQASRSDSSSTVGESDTWTSKVFSNNYNDCCQVKCAECGETLVVRELRIHTKKKHGMNIGTYKYKHGSRLQYIRTTYHKCELCSEEILLDSDSLASHCKSRHSMTLQDFNDKYMIGREGKEEDEDLPSTSKASSSSCKILTKEPVEEGVEEKEDKTTDAKKEKLVENDRQWYNGNTFICIPCKFSTKSLVNLKVHIKQEHGSNIAKWSNKYTSSRIMYACQFCGEEVTHEKEAIARHVDSHFLTLETYGRMYERKKILELERQKEEEKEKKEIDEKVLLKEREYMQAKEIYEQALQKSEKKNDDLDELNESLARLSKPAVKEEEVKDAKNSSPLTSEKSIALKEEDKPSDIIPPGKGGAMETDDVFVYLCPFPSCEFQTDFQGMKYGPAANHGIEVHNTQPWEIKKHGLKWKKVSLEHRMSSMFDD